jgi:NodT family efflux transporter outer membrane factor (OMF) lipoprotein
VELRSFQSREAIARENLQAQADTVELTRAKFQAGLTSDLDVARAESLLATTTSAIPPLEAGVRQSAHRLAVLLGREPGALLAELEAPAAIPPVPGDIPVGLPSDLLRRRPDVRRAERDLAGATADIGIATADLFPRFSLTGSFGFSSESAGEVFEGDARFWSIGPAVRWPVLDGGRIRANIAVANARQEQAAARYEAAVLTALEDVENALVNYSRERARLTALRRAVAAEERAVELATQLYGPGLTDFISVLDTQRELFSLQDQAVASQGAVTANLIALYKALGGGWESFEPPSPPASGAVASDR